MRNKILGVFACILVIAASIPPVAGTINKKENDKFMLSINHTRRQFDLYHDFVYIKSNERGNPSNLPNDPDFNKQWYLHSTGKIFWVKILLGEKIPIWFPFRVKPGIDIQALEAWDIETGSPDVVIAIPDTGVDYLHPDLAANIWTNTDEIPGNNIDDDNNGFIDDVIGWDFAYDDNDPMDDSGHGTVCAGVAGAVGNNGIGMAGVAWNCKIMPLKVWNETGSGSWEDMAMSIRYAADNGADIISISAADYEVPNVMLDAVNYAYSKGVFICAGAGNRNTDTKFYPAAYENVTAVGMTNTRNKARSNSNYGEWVDIAAPGNLIYTTWPSQEYCFVGGTSIACPMVAGVAALLLSKDPSLSPDEVKTRLCNNVDPYSGDKYVGTGRLNAYKALAALTLSMQ